MHINELDYLETQGLSVLVYQNQFHDVFRDRERHRNLSPMTTIGQTTVGLKDAWPFLWYENEYVADAASIFILAANAAEALTRSTP